MASVYSNAFLTIAATKSASGAGGLFTSTPDFEICGSTPSGEAYRVFFREEIDHIHVHQTLGGRHPLFLRAWCYQERLLSKRVLHFGSQELFFECRTHSQCECGGIAGNEIALAQPKLEFAETLYSGSANSFYAARSWRAMVMQYADLALTVKSDRLPAFAGVARQVAQVRNCRYLAGLWEDSIVDDLLWQGGGSSNRRPPSWRAPTWSWASIEGSIYYGDAPLFWSERDADEKRDENSFTPCCHVSACDILLASADEFGEVERALLTLAGPCTNGSLRYNSQKTPMSTVSDGETNPTFPKPSQMTAYHLLLDSAGTFDLIPDFDLGSSGQHHVASGTKVLCIKLCAARVNKLIENDPVVDHFLVLVRRKWPDGHCERIGIFRAEQGQIPPEVLLSETVIIG